MADLISLNLSQRDPVSVFTDSIALAADAFREFAEAMTVVMTMLDEARASTARFVAGELRKLPRSRRQTYWRERRAGAEIFEALEVAAAEAMKRRPRGGVE